MPGICVDDLCGGGRAACARQTSSPARRFIAGGMRRPADTAGCAPPMARRCCLTSHRQLDGAKPDAPARVRRRQSGHIQRSAHVHLAEKARRSRRHHRVESPAARSFSPRPACSVGRRCTVHWEHAPALQEAFPDIGLTRSLFELDGRPHHLLGRCAGAGHDDRAHHARSWLCAGRGGGRLVLAHACAGRREAAAHGFAVAARHRRREAAEDAQSHGSASRKTAVARERLAKLAGVSLRQLERSFQRQARARHARALSDVAVGACAAAAARDIADRFWKWRWRRDSRSASQFSRAFRRNFGFTPRESRQRDQRPATTTADRDR